MPILPNEEKQIAKFREAMHEIGIPEQNYRLADDGNKWLFEFINATDEQFARANELLASNLNR